MKTFDRRVPLTFGMMTVFALAGCGEERATPLSPADSEAFLSIAPGLSVDWLAEELGLDASQTEEFGEKLEALHEMMLEVRALKPDPAGELSAEDHDGLHDAFGPIMTRAHESHRALLDVLNEEQRERFIAHVHEQMAEHHEAMGHRGPHPMDGMHDDHGMSGRNHGHDRGSRKH